MLFLYLILGHLIGDFVMQSGKLIVWKNKSWAGIAVHVAILFFVTLVLILPFLSYKVVWIGLMLVYFSHFIEDILKIEFVKKYPKYEFFAFIADQVVHFTAISIFYFYIKDKVDLVSNNQIFQLLYVNNFIVYLLLTITVCSYTWDIFEYQIKKLDDSSVRYFRNYQGMAFRTLIGICLFGLLWFL